ncbi:MAG: sigma-70 family RNA polymerase sigma factor [Pseudonocardiales bacterium]|nr:MAG: sigma-70 family RNA polymerase sigma factor [Pseudonocardiales bacterium]
MGSDAPVAVLVARACAGDQTGWDALVDRYGCTVIAVCRRYRLSDADAADVRQTVWLRLLESLPKLRDAEALPGWLVTTTRRECVRLRRLALRCDALPGDGEILDESEDAVVDLDLLRAERHAALRAAFADLPTRCQLLLRMLMGDPPTPYEEISRQLNMPIGSIGPTRARCLSRLRESPFLVALTEEVDVRRTRD